MNGLTKLSMYIPRFLRKKISKIVRNGILIGAGGTIAVGGLGALGYKLTRKKKRGEK